MTLTIPNSLEFRGLYWYPNPEQNLAYYYLPGALQPQRDAVGQPMLTLVTVGSGGYLQLSVVWDAAAETLEALRQHIAQREGLEDSAVLRLAFAPVTVQGVSLHLGDGSGSWSELQTAHSSGFPPYTTIFNMALNAEQQTQVAAALNGREDFLQVHYDACLQVIAAVSGQLRGDATAIMTQLKDKQHPKTLELTPEAIQTCLQDAIAHGDLQLTLSGSDQAPSLLQEQVRTQVLSQAADLLLRFLADETGIPDITRLDVSASRTQPVTIAFDLTTDVGPWFSSGAGVITPAPGVSPTSLPPESPTGGLSPPVPTRPAILKVYLNFPASEVPLGLVQVGWGSTQATLTPPDFAVVTLPAPATEEPLSIETSYTTGGGSYKSTLAAPPSGDLGLTPTLLGLVHVTVDARPLEQVGAQKARIVMRYQPEAEGIADERTLYFRNADWQASWFLISRSDSLSGALTYEWQVTDANQTLIKQDWVTATSPQITLSLASA
jgi:hypothetical protein